MPEFRAFLRDIWRKFGGHVEELWRTIAGKLEGNKRRLEGKNLVFKNLIFYIHNKKKLYIRIFKGL